MKTADEILSAKKCGDLFSCGDKDTVILEYREMVKQYHPDTCTLPNASQITSRLNQLYEDALRLIEENKWEVSNLLVIHNTKNTRFSTRYLKSFPFELGEAYVADRSVTYLFPKENKAFYDNALARIKALRYANEKMEKEFSRFLPEIVYSFETKDGRYCLILRKTPDVFILADVLKHYNGSIPDRHVAWIVSRLCNLCCFFDYTGIAHNGLTLENCFVSPQNHSVILLGGWWYAMPQKKKLLGVPRVVYDVMPVKAKGDRSSSIMTDLESMKQIGRKLLGSTAPPEPMKRFLEAGSSSKAKEEFSRWSSALDQAYGERKFIAMPVGRAEIYPDTAK